MARVNVYVPDDLLAQAKRAELPISELAQRALTDALAHQARVTALQQFVDGLVASQGPATEAELIEADAWAASVVDAATSAPRRTKRAV